MSTTTAISSQVASCTQADEPTPKTDDIASRHVLFAFDDESIPLIRGVELKMQRPEKYSANPVIARGAEGQPDAERAQQPAVVREGDRWRMWYSAPDGAGTRVAYAESDDGLTWRKPELGLA